MATEQTPDGELALGDLQSRWAACAEVRRRAQRSQASYDAHVICARSVDEAQVGGHRAYLSASRYLAVADENHEALVHLLEHHGATQTVPWNLLRPSFEAAFYTLWLLNSDDSAVRRQRGVRLEWLDDEAARSFRTLVLKNPGLAAAINRQEMRSGDEVDRSNTQTFAREADQVGLTYTDRNKQGRKVTPRPIRVAVANELPNLLPDPDLTIHLETTWKTLSGIQHALGSAILRVSDQLDTGRRSIGGRELHLTINDDAFHLAAAATNLLRSLAWDRYGQCHRPARSNQPIDLSQLGKTHKH